MSLVGGPWDRRPATVASTRIDDAIRRHDGVEEPELLALVEERRPGKREQHHRRHARRLVRTAVALTVADDVGVRERPRRPGPALVEQRERVDDAPPHPPRVPWLPEEGEVEGQVQLVA